MAIRCFYPGVQARLAECQQGKAALQSQVAQLSSRLKETEQAATANRADLQRHGDHMDGLERELHTREAELISAQDQLQQVLQVSLA